MARRIPDGFVPLHTNYLRDLAIQRAGVEAELLYIRGLAHSKGGKTDGFLSTFDLPVFGVRLKRVEVLAAALVREGLWVEAEDGWRIRSWTKWNGTPEEIAEQTARQQAAAVRTNHNRWHQEQTKNDCPLCQSEPLRLVGAR